eukprot:SAG31_NODE_3413_length_4303_cov_1.471694_2_plen_220_part_00
MSPARSSVLSGEPAARSCPSCPRRSPRCVPAVARTEPGSATSCSRCRNGDGQPRSAIVASSSFRPSIQHRLCCSPTSIDRQPHSSTAMAWVVKLIKEVTRGIDGSSIVVPMLTVIGCNFAAAGAQRKSSNLSRSCIIRCRQPSLPPVFESRLTTACTAAQLAHRSQPAHCSAAAARGTKQRSSVVFGGSEPRLSRVYLRRRRRSSNNCYDTIDVTCREN